MSKDYDVGYRKPPKATQFKPGKSGNAKGRPKGTKNFKTDLLEELQEQILIKESGKGLSVSKQRAFIKAIMAGAVKGDARAANLILNMLLKNVPDEAEAKETSDLTQTDLAILEQFKQETLKASAAPEKTDDEGS